MKKMTKVVVAAAVFAGGVFGTLFTADITSAATNTKIVSVQEDHKQIISQTVKLAKKGKTINSGKFGIHSSGKEIRKAWGEPDEGSDDQYLYYSKRKIEFVLNDDKVVFINSYDQRFANISIAEVRENVPGKPIEKSGEDAYYLEYQLGKHVLEFAFYYDAKGKPDTIKEVYVR